MPQSDTIAGTFPYSTWFIASIDRPACEKYHRYPKNKSRSVHIRASNKIKATVTNLSTVSNFFKFYSALIHN